MSLKYRIRKAHKLDGSVKFYAEIEDGSTSEVWDLNSGEDLASQDAAKSELEEYMSKYPDVVFNEYIYLDSPPASDPASSASPASELPASPPEAPPAQ